MQSGTNGSKGRKLEGEIVLKYFKVIKKIGTGAFGQIYQVEHQNKNGEVYALKVEPATTRHPQLLFEIKMYKYLHHENEVQGIPKVYAAGNERGYNMMLMDMLGKSLEDLFVERDKKFSLKTVVLVGLQVLERIEYLHKQGFIHRDLKPDNLLMGTGNKSHILHIIDMGLSKKYISKQKKHIPYKEGKELTGTARYASIATHKGIEQSRRDDIESIGYLLMYFLRGILPWQNMKASTAKVKYEMIMSKKVTTPLETLCQGFPNEFISFISYARGLQFEETPDYDYLKGQLKAIAANQGIELDAVYDWTQN